MIKSPPAPAPPRPSIPPPVVRADVLPLLEAYRQALALAAAPPPSYQTRFGWLTRFLAWLRPEWGASRFTVDHMRRRVDALNRRYCLRLALGEDDGNDGDDRAALERFESSLPSAPSRVIVVVLPVIAMIVMAQVLFATFGAVKEEQAAFEKLSALVDLNPSHFNDAVRAILQSDFLTVLDLIGVVTLSVYLVLRPFVSGFQLKRMIVGIPGAARGRRADSPLARRAGEIAVHAQERALFEALGMRAPADPRFDLLVKATLVACWIALGMFTVVAAENGDETTGGVIILAACAARAAWLGREWVRRDRRVTGETSELACAHTSAD